MARMGAKVAFGSWLVVAVSVAGCADVLGLHSPTHEDATSVVVRPDSEVVDDVTVVADSESPDSSAGDDATVGQDGTLLDDGSPLEDGSLPDDAGSVDDANSPEVGCAPNQKSCGNNKCAYFDNPDYGCGSLTCSPCGPDLGATYVCQNGACVATGCKSGYKKCNGVCEKEDAAHGCGGSTCKACPAVNGKAICTNGACAVQCDSNYKLCNGLCVSKSDPTYGCSGNSCSPCPAESGTAICQPDGACGIGSCVGTTKKCVQGSTSVCVPLDQPAYGCSNLTSCDPCPDGQGCNTQGACACVPEAQDVTCAKVECGKTTNNCGEVVDCGSSKCVSPNTCGGGGQENHCGCTAPLHTCDGVSCGAYTDACGKTQECGCQSPQTCNASGQCACTPTVPLCRTGACGVLVSDGCGNKVECRCLNTCSTKCLYTCCPDGTCARLCSQAF